MTIGQYRGDDASGNALQSALLDRNSHPALPAMYIVNSLRNIDGHVRLAVDSDGDGFVDGSSNYQLIKDGLAIDLTNSLGQTFSDRSSRHWDAIKAINTDSGFKVLLAGSKRFSERFRIWDINTSGVISSISEWKSTTKALEDGWETLFGDVIQPDGNIGSPGSGTPAPTPTPTPEPAPAPDPAPTPAPAPSPSPNPSLDSDGDGFVDGSSNYQLIKDGSAINLTNTRGRTFSDSTSNNWSAIKAINSGSNFKILLAGANRFNGKFGIWDVNSSGVISSFSGWESTATALDNGWESLFGDVIQPDGTIGNPGSGTPAPTPTPTPEPAPAPAPTPEPTNDGTAVFEIVGTPETNQTLQAHLGSDDPDGNGTFSYSWQSSDNLENWINAGSGQILAISASLIGKNIRAVVAYTDAEGFNEIVTTNHVTITEPINSDDYSSDINTSGTVSIGSSTSGNLEQSGDHDWFAIELEEDKSYFFDAKGTTLEDTILYLRDNSGNLLKSDDDGGAGLNSRIEFESSRTELYYLDIGSYNDSYTGKYTISAELISATTPDTGTGFSSIDGYGRTDASRVFEQLLDINLPDAPVQGGNLWGLDNLNVPEVWNGTTGFSGTKGAGSTIAVVDTGVDLDHPEFTDRITAGYDFVDNDSIADDGEGHGTHVAGTIAGSHDDGIGISGVAPESQIMPIRVLDNNGDGYTSDVVSGVRWAVDNGADVINLSLGGGGYSQAMADVIRYASRKDSVVVMASGNYGRSSPDYPAAHAANYGIAVGAVDQAENFADFSNRAGANELDYVTAPGVGIYSSVPGGSYATMNGTSMATPHVAGIAALLKSYDDTLTPESIEDLITGTASNSISNTNQAFREPATNSDQNRLLTLETLENFKLSASSSRLIGSLNGNMATRKSTIKDLKKLNKIDDNIEYVSAILSTRKNFVTVELSETNVLASSEILRDWLSSDKFNYFEIDTQMSII